MSALILVSAAAVPAAYADETAETTVYDSSADFAPDSSGVWGGVWSARCANVDWGSVYYMDMKASYNGGLARWNGDWNGPLVNGTTMQLQAANESGVTDYNTTIRTFTAPEAGTIKIEAATISNNVGYSSDAKNLRIINATTGEKIWPLSNNPNGVTGEEDWSNIYLTVYSWNTLSQPELTVFVNEGDKINFEVRKPSTGTSTAAEEIKWTNVISYVEIPANTHDEAFTFESAEGINSGSQVTVTANDGGKDSEPVTVPFEAFAGAETANVEGNTKIALFISGVPEGHSITSISIVGTESSSSEAE